MADKELKTKISKTEEVIEELKVLFRARYPIIYISSDENEKDILKILYDICCQGASSKRYRKDLFVWDVSRGIEQQIQNSIRVATEESSDSTKDPVAALDSIITAEKFERVYVLCGFHHYLSDPSIQQRLRNFYEITAPKERKIIILLSTKNDGMPSTGKLIPPEMENIINVLEWPYPDQIHINSFLRQRIIPQLNNVFANQDPPIKPMAFSEEELTELTNACKGMTAAQIENATTKSVIKHQTLVAKTISLEKKQTIQKSSLCECVEPSETLMDLGGLDNLKKWLRSRKNLLSEEAIEFGCDLPRGALFLGPWGSGKSSAAKAVINEWGIPGLRVDASKIYNAYIGDSEKRISDILRLADSISPCILWFDEVDNLLASSDGALDSGVSSRVVGIISTWMAEHRGMVFCIFTANKISDRPPKLFRKGRLDEIFIVDLPVKEERKEIFKIHIMKKLVKQGREKDIDNINLEKVSEISHNFSGAEIQAAVNTAFMDCYNDGKRSLLSSDLIRAIKTTVPLSCTMRKDILEMREWQKGKGVRASLYEPEPISDIREYVSADRQDNLEF